jgi:peptidoglycan/xylan/chitin deacetylase (PgdA/CDA1 family)
MFLGQENLPSFLVNKNKLALSFKLFIVLLILTLVIFYPNIFLYTNNIVHAEEITIPILTYHNFTKDEGSSYIINIIEFEKQMNYLATHNYSVISLSELLEGLRNGQLPPKSVVITIDDGFKSTFTLAYPVLKKYNFPATLFIYTNFIEKNSNSLTWGEEIKEMTENKLEIGSHTLSHCNLLKNKENENYENYLARIKKEIFLSKEILESKIGVKVKFFAYPYGIYSPTIKNLAIQADYQGILNANSMNNNLNADPFSLNRQIIFGNNSFNSFIQILNQQTLYTSRIFPEDGIIESNQFVKIGAILGDNNYDLKTLAMKLGAAKAEFTFNPENNEISFASSKPLIKKSYIINISALDKNSKYLRKKSWLITIK